MLASTGMLLASPKSLRSTLQAVWSLVDLVKVLETLVGLMIVRSCPMKAALPLELACPLLVLARMSD
jgi:hypothetical protein